MKIERIDEDSIIVFLNKMRIKDKVLLSSTYLEDYFKSLFKILNDKYQVKISGYYTVTLYQNNLYGVIVDIKKEFTEYFDYYDNQVDMKIEVDKNPTFLYKVNELSNLNSIYNCNYIYLYNGELYFKPKKNINQIQLGILIENSTIVYGELCNKILKGGKNIKTKYTFV